MGRNYTPQEQYEADTICGLSKQRTVLRDMKTGEEKVLYDPDAETSKLFPNLSFLFTDGLEVIMARYDEEAVPVLHRVENALTRIISDGTGKMDDPLYLWYIGKLDQCFYYAERNHELLVEWIAGQIEDRRERTS